MGTSSSTPTEKAENKTKTPSQCRFCAGFLKETKKVEVGEVCKRCGGVTTARKGKPQAKKEGYDSLELKDEEELPPSILSRMHILPFKETLPTEDEKDTEEALLKDYLLPFFNEQKPFVKIGDRFQIKTVDFRVMACHPPEGFVTGDTKIRAFGTPLSAENKISKLHCLPIKSSLPDGKTDSKRFSEEVLWNNYIKPYFSGDDPRHVVEGDTFIYQDVQFKIIACEPKDGEVVKETQMFYKGPPIQDLNKIHILPIYETLPNHHKELSEEKLFEIYLFPYFSGRFRYCTKDDEIDIDGVDFKVMAVDPEGVSGVVTDQTRMFAGGPFVRYADIKQQQLHADEELARSLQRQESVVAPQALVMQARLEELLRRMPQNDPNRPMIERITQSLAILPYLSPQTIDRSILPMLSGLTTMTGGDPSNSAAAQGDIESLPTRVYQPKKPSADGKSEDEFNTCRVCLMDYEAGEELRTLPCFHSYHKACIDKWLQTNRKCPICKNPITTA